MDDSKIIELFFARDEKGVEELDRKYSRHATSLARSILRSTEDAEECVNDAWLRVWDSIPPNNPHNLRGYISVIVRNLCLDRIRSTDAAKRPKTVGELKEELNEIFGESTEDVIEAHLLLRAINDFLGGLATADRMLFMGRYWHLQSIKELCSHLHMSDSNVKTILFRLREQLREYLKKEGFEI